MSRRLYQLSYRPIEHTKTQRIMPCEVGTLCPILIEVKGVVRSLEQIGSELATEAMETRLAQTTRGLRIHEAL